MLRDAAVLRIHQGLGFRPLGTSIESVIISRLRVAQDYMEQGKSLPWFLLRKEQALMLADGEQTVDLPAGFIRESDENRLHFTPTGTEKPYYLSRRYVMDGMRAYAPPSCDPTFPRVYAIRRGAVATPGAGVETTPSPGVVDFFVTADRDYSLLWDYYGRDDVLTTNIENNWLRNAPEVLIGWAGLSIARDLRDGEAVQVFTQTYQDAHKALFAEMVAQEEASQPLQMGADL